MGYGELFPSSFSPRCASTDVNFNARRRYAARPALDAGGGARRMASPSDRMEE